MAKTLTGVVTSDRSDKTITVLVSTRKTHPIYKKQYSSSSKFMAHDENNEAKVGDKVIISESRPLSARKRYTLDKILHRAIIRHEEETNDIIEPKTKPATESKVEIVPETKEVATDVKAPTTKGTKK